MAQTIDNQIVLENKKLEKLEIQEHQWISQAMTNISSIDKIRPQLQRLLSTTNEKAQLLGSDMVNILNVDMQKKMEKLLSLTTLTINIHTGLQAWEEFQHQLSMFEKEIVEACVKQQPTTSHINIE